MPLIAKDRGQTDNDPIPAGMHHGICYGVIDLGTEAVQTGKFPSRRKVAISFELPDERGKFTRDGEEVDLPRAISTTQTLSLNSKGKLRPMLESWRGRPFTEGELDGFDLGNLLGVNALLNIVHEPRNGKTYATIKAVTPLAKGMPKKASENPHLFFSLDGFGPDSTFPDRMPEWIRERVRGSIEYREATAPTDTTEEDNRAANVVPGPPDADLPF